MAGRALRIALGAYDRTLPLMAGLVSIENVEATFESPPFETMFARAFDEEAYYVTEMSFSNFLILHSEGRCPYVGLPVFPSRAFRHGAFYVRADRDIRSPRDLAGRRVGVREFSMTAALVARGVLSDEYGLDPASIDWICGPADGSDAPPIVRKRPDGIRLEMAPPGVDLSGLLAAGELDAMLAYKPPPAFLEGNAPVRRLFEDYRSVEADYARRTGRFPIMHLVGIRTALAREDPSLCLRVCEGLEASQAFALSRASALQAPFTVDPWGAAALAHARSLMPDAFWKSGLPANRPMIADIGRWSHAQGLIPAAPDPDALFAEAVRAWDPAAPA